MVCGTLSAVERSRKNAFCTDIQCQHQNGCCGDHFGLSGDSNSEQFLNAFCKKSSGSSHAVYDETGIFSNASGDGSDAGIE